jgi:hypothetical protein
MFTFGWCSAFAATNLDKRRLAFEHSTKEAPPCIAAKPQSHPVGGGKPLNASPVEENAGCNRGKVRAKSGRYWY